MLAREPWQIRTLNVLEQVFEERLRQVAQYGHNEDLENGTGPNARWLLPASSNPAKVLQEQFREEYEEHEAATGKPTWMHLVREELAEAAESDNPERLAEELLQLAALAVSWVEKLENRP